MDDTRQSRGTPVGSLMLCGAGTAGRTDCVRVSLASGNCN